MLQGGRGAVKTGIMQKQLFDFCYLLFWQFYVGTPWQEKKNKSKKQMSYRYLRKGGTKTAAHF